MSDLRALDDLARALARPMPRGRMLRVAAVAALGLVVPAWRWTPTAQAGFCGCDTPGASEEIDCDGAKACCCPGDEPYCAKNPTTAACRPKACPNGQEWCGGDVTGAVRCCKPPLACGYDAEHGTLACICPSDCGKACCTKTETCVKRSSCCPNTRVCGDACCASGKTCAFMRGATGGRGCCPANRIVRRTLSGQNVKFCCPPGTVRVTGRYGSTPIAACCPPGDRRCCDVKGVDLGGSGPDDLVPLNPYVTGAIFCVRGKPRPLL